MVLGFFLNWCYIMKITPKQPAGASTYYRALITVEGSLRNIPENFRLIPGIECEAEIKTGTRRIIEYIIYPLIKAHDETAREP